MALVSLLLLSVCLAEIHYVSFMGQTLANHSYVDLSTVGSGYDGSDSVQCHTDLSTCCRVLIVETGISLMALDCHLPVVVSLMVRLMELDR